MKENTIDSILLDLDGTLVDTAPEMHLALNVLLNEEAMAPQPYEAVRPHVSNGVMGIFRNIFEDNPQINGRRFNKYLDIYEEHLGINAQVFPEMIEVIKTIENKGIPWGIVTNKSKRFAVPLLEKLKLFDRASCVVCGDTTTEKKPHPESINHALSLLNVLNTKRSFYIGDSKKDIDAAKAAGISSIACTFGYIEEDDDPEKWYADYVIDQPLEILKILNNLT
jgi:phosphoglycolate phosphatase